MKQAIMKAVEFKQQNIIIAKDQKPYLPLPARISKNGQYVTSCWRMDLFSRILFIFTGKIYVTQLTFGRPLQPLSVNQKYIKEIAD